MGKRSSLEAWMLFYFIGLASLPDVFSDGQLDAATATSGAGGPCSTFPCGPVGACFLDARKPGGFDCRCDEGYQREQGAGPCVDVDECAGPVNPCGQHGICINQLGAYDCNCSNGYVLTTIGNSLQCMTENNACRGNPCGPAGHCNPQPDGSFVCDCVPGYKVKVTNGPCEEIEDPCYGNPCGVGGICDAILGGGYHCTCLPGYFIPPEFAQYGGSCHEVYPGGQSKYGVQLRAQHRH